MQKIHNGISYEVGQAALDPTRPTLVFIHGAGGSGIHFRPQIKAFEHIANTLAIDLPSHGNSLGPSESEVQKYAERVARFVTELSLPDPIPVGFSMGGAITQQLLVEQVLDCRAAILIATGAKLRVADIIFKSIQNDFEGYVRLKGELGKSSKTDPSRIQFVLEDTKTCPPEVVLGDFQACDGFDVRKRLDTISIPVLLIFGQDDQLTPPGFGHYLHKHIRQSTLHLLPDAGHLVSVEQPTSVNEAIGDFLQAL